MGINIKNPETTRLIRELAELTGEGQTEAVTTAVKERLERLAAERREVAAHIMEIAKITGPRLKGLPDHGDLLYDEKTGLPK
jgi:antitoxin VapB